MFKVISVIISLSVLFLACKKDDLQAANNDNDNVQTISADTAYFTIFNSTQMGVSARYSCCLRIMWGDGLIDNFTSPYNSTIMHNYATTTNNTIVQVNAKGLSLINLSNFAKTSSCDFSKCPNIENIAVANNQIASLDVTNCSKLTTLSCYMNKLTTLNLTNLIKLKEIRCNDNLLTSLNTTSATSLTLVNCNNNQITTLDLTNNKNMSSLNCSNNKISNLKIASGVYLTNIDCSNNLLSAASLNNVFDSLPKVSGGSISYVINIKNNPGTAQANISIANNKGWSVIKQ